MTARRILFLDFWSDRNRGDAAMQVAQLQLARRHERGCHLTVMSAFGFNQVRVAVEELDESATEADDVVGGFRPTFVPNRSDSPYAHAQRRRLLTLTSLGLLPFILAAVLLSLRLPPLRMLLPGQLRRSVVALAHADVILWNGRNFRSDSRLREPYEFLQLLVNPAIAFAARAPVAALGVSYWEPKTATGAHMVRAALRRCFFISAREQESHDRIAMALRDDGRHPDTQPELELLPDLSLALVAPLMGTPESRQRPDSSRPLAFALTVVDWPNSGESARNRYANALSAFIRRTLASAPTARFTLYPQVTVELESAGELYAELCAIDPERVRVAAEVTTVEELAAAYSGQDLLIATRMHSAIFATCALVPVVTIPYDKGGKWGILEMLGQGDIAIPYDEVTADRLTDKVEQVWRDRESMQERVAARLPALAQRVALNVSRPLELSRDF